MINTGESLAAEFDSEGSETDGTDSVVSDDVGEEEVSTQCV